jgi:hypothetical protein
MLGRNGVIGTSAALDGPQALNAAVAQVASTGMVIDAGVLKGVAGKSETLRMALVHHIAPFLLKLSRWLRATHSMSWKNV